MRMLLIAGLVLMSGCAAQNRGPWTKDGATRADFDTDKARCDYETAAASQGTDPGMRTLIGQDLERAIRKNDLMKLCMVARGYSPPK